MIVDLFAGPGGLDEAARQLGIPSIGIEYDPGACATRRAAGHATVQGDVRQHHPADFPQADVLAGGPPCQTFSTTGNGAGRRELEVVLALAKRLAAREDITAALTGLEDVRTGLVLEPLRWALEAIDAGRPYKVIVLEQVPTVLPVWTACAELLRAEGYQAVSGIVHAEEHGVPQTRRRATMIARLDKPVALPTPLRRAYRSRTGALPAPVAMGDVLPHRGEFTIVSNYGTGGDPKKRGRRHSSEPAATITGKINRNRVLNPDGTEQPRLTASEAGQLQGFPANYPWGEGDWPQRVGNAVPVQLGRALLTAALGGQA